MYEVSWLVLALLPKPLLRVVKKLGTGSNYTQGEEGPIWEQCQQEQQANWRGIPTVHSPNSVFASVSLLAEPNGEPIGKEEM